LPEGLLSRSEHGLIRRYDRTTHADLAISRLYEERAYFEEAKEMFGLPDDFEEIVLLDPHDRLLDRAATARARAGRRPIVAKEPVSLNAPCPCGSGKKYKRCCARA
jgi:hypothetical protein